MITVAKALDALKEAGHISAWEMKHNDAYGVQWKEPVVHSDKVNVSNETYGFVSMLYFSAKSPEAAKEIAKTLVFAGGHPDWRWCAADPKSFDMQVSHFKGYHWWE